MYQLLLFFIVIQPSWIDSRNIYSVYGVHHLRHGHTPYHHYILDKPPRHFNPLLFNQRPAGNTSLYKCWFDYHCPPCHTCCYNELYGCKICKKCSKEGSTTNTQLSITNTPKSFTTEIIEILVSSTLVPTTTIESSTEETTTVSTTTEATSTESTAASTTTELAATEPTSTENTTPELTSSDTTTETDTTTVEIGTVTTTETDTTTIKIAIVTTTETGTTTSETAAATTTESGTTTETKSTVLSTISLATTLGETTRKPEDGDEVTNITEKYTTTVSPDSDYDDDYDESGDDYDDEEEDEEDNEVNPEAEIEEATTSSNIFKLFS